MVADENELNGFGSLSPLPPVMTTRELAEALGLSCDSLAQDRYVHSATGDCIPYVKIGRRVRYLREDVCRYLASKRSGGTGTVGGGGTAAPVNKMRKRKVEQE